VVQTALMNEQASPNFAGASAGFRRIPALASTPSPSNEKPLAITGNCTDHVEVAGKRQSTSLVITNWECLPHLVFVFVADHFVSSPIFHQP